MTSSALQSDLDRLVAWAKKWQLEFNTNKGKVLHFGNNNGSRNYMMNGSVLESSNIEKDLGVMISDDLKCTSHIDYVVLKASRLLGMLHRSIQSKVKAIILPLYTSLVRPHLEYCVQAWSPYYQKDIDKLEAGHDKLEAGHTMPKKSQNNCSNEV